MKKLFLLLVFTAFIVSCGDDDNEPKPVTSSIVFYLPDDMTLPKCVVGYKKDNKFYKIKEIGDLYKEKYSEELWISGDEVKELYFFSDYNDVVRFDTIYHIKINDRNTFEIKKTTKLIQVTDKEDPAQYPQ